MKMRCPNDEVLADYIEGRLAKEERFEVEDHLSTCERCLDDLVVASSVFRGEALFECDSVPAALTEAAVRAIQRHGAGSCPTFPQRVKRSLEDLSEKVSDLLTFKPTGLQLQPIRGSKTRLAKDLIQLRKKYRDFEVEIEIEKISESNAHIRVKLPEPPAEKRPIRVTLKRGKREVSSHLLSGAHVLFENVAFGHYGLTFSMDGVEVGEYHFEIRENRHGEGE